MARIEDDRWIIETEEEAEAIAKLLNEPPKVNEKLQAALDKYKSLGFGEVFESFDLLDDSDLKLPADANLKPWKYATHCLKADPSGSILICGNHQQCLYIDSSWQPSSIYHGILKEIVVEYHYWLDPERGQDITVSRSDVLRYQHVLDTEGLQALEDIYTELANTNSLGVLGSLNAIKVVKYNNDIGV